LEKLVRPIRSEGGGNYHIPDQTHRDDAEIHAPAPSGGSDEVASLEPSASAAALLEAQAPAEVIAQFRGDAAVLRARV
jgi:hypothetical protein